ncbi:MAG: DUF6783 domain-containing protein [Enterocloster sp.]
MPGSPAKCDAHLIKSNFQTRSKAVPLPARRSSWSPPL